MIHRGSAVLCSNSPHHPAQPATAITADILYKLLKANNNWWINIPPWSNYEVNKFPVKLLISEPTVVCGGRVSVVVEPERGELGSREPGTGSLSTPATGSTGNQHTATIGKLLARHHPVRPGLPCHRQGLCLTHLTGNQ